MTCKHCALVVTAEFEAVDTVTRVAIDIGPQGNSAATVFN